MPQLHESMFSPADFRVRTSARLADVPALKVSTRDYGLSSPVSFARFDPATCSWRTSQVSLSMGWGEWSETWPQAGTTRNGTSYRLRPGAPPIYERVSGFLPTPVASETKRTTPYSQGGQSLTFVIGGRPSQMLLEWMMGFPAGWCERMATRLSSPSPNGSASASSKRRRLAVRLDPVPRDERPEVLPGTEDSANG